MRVVSRWLVLALVACVVTPFGCGGKDDTGPTETDTDTDTDTDSDVRLEEWVVLRGEEERCASGGQLVPTEEQDGSWAATRLTPDRWPAEVSTVVVTYAVNDGQCRIQTPSRLRAFKGGATPPEDIEVLKESTHPARPATISDTEALLDLDGMQLDEGEHLYIAMELSGQIDGEQYLSRCWKLCFDESDGDRSFFTTQTDEPFTWGDFDAVGVAGTLTITAVGKQAAE